MALIGTIQPRNLILTFTESREPSLPLAFTALPVDAQGAPQGLLVHNGQVYNMTPDDLPLFVVYKDGGCDIRKTCGIDTMSEARFITAGSAMLIENYEPVEIASPLRLRPKEEILRIGLGVRRNGEIVFVQNRCTLATLVDAMMALNVRDGMLSANDNVYVNYLKGGIKVGTQVPVTVMEAMNFKELPRPIIVIDPGHGGKDPGAQAFGAQEKNYNLRGAKLVYEYLTVNYQGTFLLTRTDDVYMSLQDRAKYANAVDADFFLSLHVNGCGQSGYEDFVARTASKTSKEVQSIVHRETMAYLAPYGFRDRGIKQAGFYVITKTKMPALLLENLFIDNTKDATMLKDDEFFRGLYLTEAKALAKALELKPRVVVVEDKREEDLWVVQVGATHFRKTAEETLEKAKQAGFHDAFIAKKQ